MICRFSNGSIKFHQITRSHATPMPEYYIETSKGRINFSSIDLGSIKITINAWSSAKSMAVQCTSLENSEALEEFITSQYDATNVSTLLTANGWFLHVQLSDSYYGYPEFKIYQHDVRRKVHRWSRTGILKKSPN